MATLKDIADAVGVSVSTVSKILNNKSQKCASEQTQDRVWQAVRELGYTPNIHARKVASISTVTKVNVIAICMCKGQEPFFASYYNGVLEKLEMQIIAQNYTPYTCDIEDIIEKKSPLKGQKLVGLVLIGEPSGGTLSRVSKIISNLIVLSIEEGLISCDKVFCSFKNAIYKTIKEAFSMQEEIGRQVCFVGKKGSFACRFWEEYLGKHDLADFQTVYSDYTVSGGYVGGIQLADEYGEPLTVICEGRRIASGLQKAFLSREIPFSSVRFFILDDLYAKVEGQAYKSVYVDLACEECAAQALLLLIDRIRHQHKVFVAYEIASQMFSSSVGGG